MSSPVINLQCSHLDIVILRVAIISNVQNVRLQRRRKPTDDAPGPNRRWRGSQQTDPINNDIYYVISNIFFKYSFVHFSRLRQCKHY